MSEPNQRRRLSGFVAAAALVTVFSGAFAQAPTQSRTQTPAAPSETQPSAPTPQFEPTPEQLGDSLTAHQRYQAAIEAYKKAPNDSADVWNKMGIAYQMMFSLQNAERCYKKSLKLGGKNAAVLNNLGTVYDSLKNYSAAEHMYRKALKVDGQSALIHKNLGTDLLAQHRYKQGWAFYQAALALDPQIFEDSTNLHVDNPASVEDRGAMNYYMARGCVRAGQNDRAIEYLRMALNEGFTSPKKLVADIDFASLHGSPAFEQMIAAQSSQRNP
jgi:tetratricopeptide (TPR) repeat protein